MADPQAVAPVKLFLAVLWSDAVALQAILARLPSQWGDPDHVGNDHPFDVTHYYEAEMGRALQRRLVAFAELVPPESLRDAKLASNRLEAELSVDRRRRVNLDVGYLDHSKIVLGSVKYAGQKIHLGDGIYADLIARYERGRYQPFPWTFPDFRDGRYDQELGLLRRRYLMQLRAWRQHLHLSGGPGSGPADC